MKKWKLLSLCFVFAVGALFFSACTKKEEIKVTSITLSDSEITLKVGAIKTISVNVSPDDATTKDFEITCLNGLVNVETNLQDSCFVLKAPNTLGSATKDVINVKAKDGSGVEAQLTVNLSQKNAVVASVPQNLSFNEEKGLLTWDSTECNGYRVCINNTEEDTNTSSYKIDLSKYAGKDVSCKVMALGQSASYNSAYAVLNFKVLGTPQNIVFDSDESTISWSEVASANGYQVYFDGSSQKITTTTFSVLGKFGEVKDYEIRVRAIGTDDGAIVSGAYCEKIVISKLAIPQVSFRNSVLTWNTINGANNYIVRVTNGTGILSTYKINNCQLSFAQNQLDAGEYKIVVTAVNTEDNLKLDSEYSPIITINKLNSPSNFRVENGVLVWDKDPNTMSFVIYLNGSMLGQTESYEENNFKFDTKGTGTYTISVVANGAEYRDLPSEESAKFTVTKLAEPKPLQLYSNESGNCCVKWNSVYNASSYKVVVASDENFENQLPDIPAVTEPTCVLPNDVVSGGTYYVKVMAMASTYVEGQPAYVNSNYSTSLKIEKQLTVESFSITDQKVTWESPSQADSSSILGYSVKVVCNDTTEEYNIASQTANYFDFATATDLPYSTTYSLSVKVLANQNVNLLDGDWSTAITVERIVVPTLSVSKGSICVSDDVNAIVYSIYDGQQLKSQGKTIADLLTTLAKNHIYSITAKALNAGNAGEYVIDSNESKPLNVKILPTITNLNITPNGELTYEFNTDFESGNNDYYFQVELSGKISNNIENGKSLRYSELSSLDAGTYFVNVSVKSTTPGNDGNTDSFLLLNSDNSDTKAFSKLETPSNLKVTSFAGTDGTELGLLLKSLSTSDQIDSRSGSLCWDTIGDSTYKLTFDGDENKVIYTAQNYVNLQGSDIPAGSHTVVVSAIGVANTSISSDDSSTSVSFTKLATPTNVCVNTDGNIQWTFDQGSVDLMSKDDSAITFIMVVGGKYYTTLDTDMSKYDTTNPVNAISSFTASISANISKFPADISESSCTLQIFALPFNSYISSTTIEIIQIAMSGSYLDIKVSETSALSVVSDLSNSISIKRLNTPLSLKMAKDGDDEVISWSPLNYKASDAVLRGFKVNVKQTADKTSNKDSFYITTSTDDEITEGGKTYKNYHVENFEKENCQWIFSEENFNKYFSLTYTEGTYEYSLTAISVPNSTGTDDAGKVYYFTNSFDSAIIEVKVLATPILCAKNGVVVWTGDENASGYQLKILGTAVDKTVDLEGASILSYSLDKTYTPGAYTFQVMSVGNGTNTISSVYCENQTFTKLNAITSICVEDGIIKYAENSVVKSNVGCYYRLVFRGGANTWVSNEKNLTYETSNENLFPGGKQYIITVVANGNDEYLSSDESYSVTATKLQNVGSLNCTDGNLSWQIVPFVSSYKVTVGGTSCLQDETTLDFNNFGGEEISSGQYNVAVKAIGNDTYLNSSEVATVITKLSEITNFKVVNGVLTWDNDTTRAVNDYVIAVTSGTDTNSYHIATEEGQTTVSFDFADFDAGTYSVVVTNNGGASVISSKPTVKINIVKLATPENLKLVEVSDLQIQNLKVSGSVLSWDNDTTNGANTYSVALTIGQTTETRSVSTSATDLTASFNFNTFSTNKYDVVITNTSATTSVSIRPSVHFKVTLGLNSNSEKILTLGAIEGPGSKAFTFENTDAGKFTQCVLNYNGNYSGLLDVSSANGFAMPINITINDKTTYYFSTQVIGSNTTETLNITDTYYINSSYSEVLIIKVPSMPQDVQYVMDNDEFTGKVTWSVVSDADFYIIRAYKEGALNTDILKTAYPSCIVKDETSYVSYIVSKEYNYCYVGGAGKYKFDIATGLNVNGLYSEPAPAGIMVNGVMTSQGSSIDYKMFGNGVGTRANPYIIKDCDDFMKIKYNMYASYVFDSELTTLSLDGYNISTFGSATQKFYGTLNVSFNSDGTEIVDRSAITLEKITIRDSSFSGIFACIDASGMVSNIIIKTINVSNCAKTFGVIAGQNYGSITNCSITQGSISATINQELSLKFAGIAGLNYGTISNCSNDVSITPSNNSSDVYVGGICAINYGTGKITDCSCSSEKLTGNIVGGIVADNYGTITKSYFGGKTIGASAQVIATIGVHTTILAGGIAGNSSGTISICYSFGYVGATSGSQNISAYAGGIVGKLNKSTSGVSATIENCYAYSVGLNAQVLTSLVNVDYGYSDALVGWYEAGLIIPSNNVVVTDEALTVSWTVLKVDKDTFESASPDICSILSAYYQESNNIDHPVFK